MAGTEATTPFAQRSGPQETFVGLTRSLADSIQSVGNRIVSICEQERKFGGRTAVTTSLLETLNSELTVALALSKNWLDSTNRGVSFTEVLRIDREGRRSIDLEDMTVIAGKFHKEDMVKLRIVLVTLSREVEGILKEPGSTLTGVLGNKSVSIDGSRSLVSDKNVYTSLGQIELALGWMIYSPLGEFRDRFRRTHPELQEAQLEQTLEKIGLTKDLAITRRQEPEGNELGLNLQDIQPA